MSREIALTAGRAFVAGALVDTCVITRETGAVTDPDTGVVTKTYATIYTGPCQVQQGEGSAGQSLVGEASLRLASLTLKLPIAGTENVRAEDIVTITACEMDSALVGRAYFLTGELAATFKTARKLGLTEVLS
jgi:hypothetical protein